MKRIIAIFIVVLFFFNHAGGQDILIRHGNKDTAYIREYYKKHLVLRLYESTKFNNFKYIDGRNKLVFKPNDHNNFGFGFNYRFISLNFGFYFPSADKNNSTYGITKPLDLQNTYLCT